MTVHAARVRIQIEYIEMPGLNLTLPQIARLCAVPADLCEPAVHYLVEGGFLARTADGRFLRRGAIPCAEGIVGPRSLATAHSR